MQNIPEMSPPPVQMERDQERDQELEMARYRDMEREQERGRELEIEREAAKPKSVPPPRQTDLSSASDRPFACPHPGCTKRYIHEYKLNLHLRNSHADENLEFEERVDSDGEDDIDEGFTPASRTPARGSGRGKLKIIPKREPVETKQKKRGKMQKEVDLNLRMRVSNEPTYYGGGPVKQAAPDSEETEEDDAENTEDEGFRYYQSRGDRNMVDDEDTEDDGDQF